MPPFPVNRFSRFAVGALIGASAAFLSSVISESYFISAHRDSNPYVKIQDLHICTFGIRWYPLYVFAPRGTTGQCTVDNNRYLYILLILSTFGGVCALYTQSTRLGGGIRDVAVFRCLASRRNALIALVALFVLITIVNVLNGTEEFPEKDCSCPVLNYNNINCFPLHDKYGNRLWKTYFAMSKSKTTQSVTFSEGQLKEISACKSRKEQVKQDYFAKLRSARLAHRNNAKSSAVSRVPANPASGSASTVFRIQDVHGIRYSINRSDVSCKGGDFVICRAFGISEDILGKKYHWSDGRICSTHKEDYSRLSIPCRAGLHFGAYNLDT